MDSSNFFEDLAKPSVASMKFKFPTPGSNYSAGLPRPQHSAMDKYEENYNSFAQQPFAAKNKELDREENRDKRIMPILPKIPAVSNMPSGKPYSYFGFNDRFKQYHDDEMGSLIKPVDWSKMEMPAFQKDFYQEHPFSQQRSNEEIESFRRDNEIFLRSHLEVPRPFITFEEASLPDYLLDELYGAGFERPTPIQAQAWPVILKGHDLIGIAQTGSGKTLAFILPSIVHINAQPPIQSGDGPIALVLAPTRELAMQIKEECNKFGFSSRLRTTCIYGGVDRKIQRSDLLRGSDIVIATPGRLIDFLEMDITNLLRVTYLILDEADRMLDMGFEPQIRKILSQVRPDRQTLMWSATWPKEVQKLALDFCGNPVYLQIGESENTINTHITQIVQVIPEMHKPKM